MFPLSNPFRGVAGDPRPPAPRDWARLASVGLLLVFLVVTVSALKTALRRPPGESPLSTVPVRLDPEPAPSPIASASPAPEQLPPLKADAETLRLLAGRFPDGREETDLNSRPLTALRSLLRDAGASLPVDATVAASSLVADPAAHRGRIVRVRGPLTTILDEPLPGGGTVPVAHLQVQPDGVLVHAILPERPDLAPARRRSGFDLYDAWLEIDGLFLRSYEFEGLPEPGRDQGPMRTAAVLVATSVRVARPPDLPDPRPWFIAIAGAAGAVIVAAILLGRRRRRGTTNGER